MLQPPPCFTVWMRGSGLSSCSNAAGAPSDLATKHCFVSACRSLCKIPLKYAEFCGCNLGYSSESSAGMNPHSRHRITPPGCTKPPQILLRLEV